MTYKCTGTCRRTGLTINECGASFYSKKCPYCLGPIAPEGKDVIMVVTEIAQSDGPTVPSEKAWLRGVLDDANKAKKEWPKWAQ